MQNDKFLNRHIGPDNVQIAEMLQEIGISTVEELINQTIPSSIRLQENLDLPQPKTEAEIYEKLIKLGKKNKLYKTYIGLGYYGAMMPPVIQRNVLENPAWYTSYTPYQAEISQGRLEALLNFQTVIAELTAMDIANASLLDEATAAAEAMRMLFDNRPVRKKKLLANKFFIDKKIFPQTLSVMQLRAEPLGIELVVGDFMQFDFDETFFGALVQYPNSDGEVIDYK